MVDPELLDLVPLFVAEGRRRLERIHELLPTLLQPESAREVRRELHTLKGSCRMLNLREMAEACHRCEEIVHEPDDRTAADLVEILDRLTLDLGRLERGEDLDQEQQPDSEPIASEGSFEHRITAEAADRLASGATASRLLSLSGLALTERIEEMAQLAERGVNEPMPEQVLAMLATRLRRIAAEAEGLHRRLHAVAERQVERLLDLQLQPLRPFLLNLGRHARELATELGKEIEVTVEGGDARLDRRIASELQSAFVHLVRNAVDHGFEAPETRDANGKPQRGQLVLRAAGLGDRVEIEVRDDGAGIDAATVLLTAIEAGLVDPTRSFDDRSALQLLFSSGFSTRRQVSDVSGRGVGLDAVGTAVRQLGGEVWIESNPGKGSSIFVQVPAARRGEKVLVLREGRQRLALPKAAVVRILRASEGILVGDEAARIDGHLAQVASLARLLGRADADHETVPVLISVRSAGADRVLAVEEIEGEEEVLVRPIASRLGLPAIYGGMALLPTGEPIAVLAPRSLVAEGSHFIEPPSPIARRRLQVLLAEDSLVTREMERRMLEEEGFEVTAVADAEEALGHLGENVYDCLVTDLEMPGMNGFELTRKVRSIERLAQLPVIIVSTRDRPGDRLAGLEAGADAYIPKQQLESRKLASVIRRMSGSR